MPFYELRLNGVIHPRLNKRGVILRLVHAAISAGVRPEQLSPLFDNGERSWFFGQGHLTAEQLRAQIPPGRQGRFFLDEQELLRVGDRTYALSNQWGDPSWSRTVRDIAAAWPALGIELRPLDAPVAPAQRPAPAAGGGGNVGGDPGPAFPDVPHQILGAAGEYYVLFQLHRRGLLAGLTPRGYKEVDVIVLGPEQQVAASLQVKTRRVGNNGGWRMHARHEEVPFAGLLYCFVDLEPARPVTFIVPAPVVAEAVAESHAAWLQIPGHNDHDMRTITGNWGFPVPGYGPDWMEPYREAWQFVFAAP